MTTSPPKLLAEAGWIQRLAHGLVSDPEVAADLAQDTWVAALRARPANDRPLRPWLATVMRNFLRERGRRTRRPAEVEPDSLASLPSGDVLAERAELHERLVCAVRELPEPGRSTVLLRFYEGLSSVEIAQRLGVPDATVRARQKRALERLRERLDREHPGGRSAWVSALLPLASTASWPTGPAPSGGPAPTPFLEGVLAMQITTKNAAIVAAVFVLGAAGVVSLTDLFGGGAEPRAVEARAEVLAGEAQAEPETLVAEGPREVVPALAPELPSVAPEAPRWTARLVDSVTGEPVPEFTLEAEQSETELQETLVSGAEGKIVATSAFAPGRIALLLLDQPGPFERGDTNLYEKNGGWSGDDVLSAKFDPGVAGAPDLAIKVGPTFELDLRLPDGLESSDCVASIQAPVDRVWTRYRRILHTAPVRTGGLARESGDPWVRFGPLSFQVLPEEGPWSLEVRSLDGTWLGTAPVESLIGIYPSLVSIELERAARVEGRVTTADGRPVAEASVRVGRPTGDPRSDGYLGWEKTDAGGDFVLEWIPPGEHRIWIESERHVDLERGITCVAGETARPEYLLEELASGGDVSGRLTSRSGTYQSLPMLMLQSPGTNLIEQALEWVEVDGRWEAPFRFEDVPAGEYELVVNSFMDKFRWEPARTTVSPPASGLELVCLDDVGTTHLGLDVLEAETGKPVGRFKILYSANGGSSVGLGGLTSGGVHLADFPDDGTFVWSVFSDGRETVFGSERDFTSLEQHRNGPLRRAEVRLREGWSARLRVREASSERPLAGVQVLIGTELVATTDADGVAVVYSPSGPLQPALRLAGYTSASEEGSMDAVDLGGNHLWHDFWLRLE